MIFLIALVIIIYLFLSPLFLLKGHIEIFRQKLKKTGVDAWMGQSHMFASGCCVGW